MLEVCNLLSDNFTVVDENFRSWNNKFRLRLRLSIVLNIVGWNFDHLTQNIYFKCDRLLFKKLFVDDGKYRLVPKGYPAGPTWEASSQPPLSGTDLGNFTGGSSFISARKARRNFFGTPWNPQDSREFKLSSILQLKLHNEKDWWGFK